MPVSLETKLQAFDENAEWAAAWLAKLLLYDTETLIKAARQRHIEGHYKYGDKNLVEWSLFRLYEEMVEELADAIVYSTRIRQEHDERMGVPDSREEDQTRNS